VTDPSPISLPTSVLPGSGSAELAPVRTLTPCERERRFTGSTLSPAPRRIRKRPMLADGHRPKRLHPKARAPPRQLGTVASPSPTRPRSDDTEKPQPQTPAHSASAASPAWSCHQRLTGSARTGDRVRARGLEPSAKPHVDPRGIWTSTEAPAR